jgi:hypothetical protein
MSLSSGFLGCAYPKKYRISAISALRKTLERFKRFCKTPFIEKRLRKHYEQPFL